jgi:hypothetical protein
VKKNVVYVNVTTSIDGSMDGWIDGWMDGWMDGAFVHFDAASGASRWVPTRSNANDAFF